MNWLKQKKREYDRWENHDFFYIILAICVLTFIVIFTILMIGGRVKYDCQVTPNKLVEVAEKEDWVDSAIYYIKVGKTMVPRTVYNHYYRIYWWDDGQKKEMMVSSVVYDELAEGDRFFIDETHWINEKTGECEKITYKYVND